MSIKRQKDGRAASLTDACNDQRLAKALRCTGKTVFCAFERLGKD